MKEQMTEYLQDLIDQVNDGYYELDMKDYQPEFISYTFTKDNKVEIELNVFIESE